MSMTLNAACVLMPAGALMPGSVVVSDDGRIAAAGPRQATPARGEVVPLEGFTLAPGFIDVHTHGGRGITFGAPGRLAEDLAEYSEWVTGTCRSASPQPTT